MNSSWSNWMFRLFKSANTKKTNRGARPAPRLKVEHLEDRVVPATVITVQEAAGTLDGFLSATDGTINATDGLGAAGSISRAALQGVGAGIQISITAENSIIFDTSLVAPVALQTMTGNSAQFIAVNGNFTFADPADSLTTAGGDLTLIDNSGTLTLGSLATNGGNISLLADSVEIATGATINAGTSGTGSIVTIQPITSTVDIDLGMETVGELSLTDLELDRITAARILRIGAPNSGDIAITAPISLSAANVLRLSLQSGDATATAVSQAAPLNVNSLAVQSIGSVVLTNALNDVVALAATVTGTAPDSFNYTDVSGFQVASVDGVAGITVANGNAANRISLVAGGAVTQATSANVMAPQLQLLGTGPFTLNNTGNNAAILAAQTTGAVSYTDANALAIDTVMGLVTTTGITTTNAAVSVDTVNGALTVVDTAAAIDVNAGTATVSLTAGDPNATDPDLTVSAGAAVTGTGGVTLIGDNIVIGAGGTVNAGVGTAFLRQFANGTLIDLGGPDGTNTLGLTDAELDQITAGVIRVGDANAGTISVTAAVNAANTSQLELITGGGILDVGGSITETRLGLTAAAATGTVVAPLDISVSNVEATTGNGGVFLSNTGTVLTIGGVNATLNGVRVTTSGPVQITNDNSIIVGATATEGISTAGGNITLQATGAASDITVNAAVSATGGNGSVQIRADNDVSLAGPVSAIGTGSVTLSANNDATTGGDFTSVTGGTVSTAMGSAAISGTNVTVGATVSSTAGGGVFLNATAAAGGNLTITAAVSTSGGNVSLTADDNISVTGPVSTLGIGTITAIADVVADGTGDFTNGMGGTVSTQGGDIVIAAQDIDLGAAVTTTLAMGSNVFLLTRDPADVINLGMDMGFGLTDADLDNVTTATLNVGEAINTAGIQVTSQITLAPALVPTLSLATSGAITDNTVTEVTDITVQSLALRAGTTGTGGIGDVGAGGLDVAVTNLAARNASIDTGAIVILNTSAALNLTTVDGITGITNQNAAMATGPVVVTTTGQMNINENVSAAGTGAVALDAATGVALATNTTVRSGDATAGGPITIRSNVGMINGTADIVLGAGSSILTRDDIFLDANPDGDAVGGGITIPNTAVLAGPMGTAANNIMLGGGEDILVSTLTAANNITILTTANVLDDAVDNTVVNAGANIVLTSGGRVGGTTPITVADVESASTAAPTAAFLAALDVAYTGTLSLTQTGAQGNVQIRKVLAGLNTGSVVINNPTGFVGNGNQLALISAGGDLTADSAFSVNGANNANLLLATTGGNDVVFNAGSTVVNNGNSTTTVMASGSAAASINAPASDNNPEIQVQSLNLVTTGGTIGAMGSPLEFNTTVLNGKTTGLVNGAAQAGGNAFLTDTTNGVTVGQFNAGTTGDVTLTSLGNITPTGSSIIAVTANDNVAEIIGDVVTLAAIGASTGTGGQIGQTGGVFFEVNSNTLNASTSNSNFWISEVGTGATAGAAVGLVTAGTTTGTTTGFLRVRNGGILSSLSLDGTADVVAPIVNLSTVAGDSPAGGNFGIDLANPLEIDGTTLNSNLAGGGNLFVRDTATGLAVQRANTTAGNIGIEVAGLGSNLTLGTAATAATVVSATGTATLLAPGSITSAAPGTFQDIAALLLSASGGTGVGASGTALETTVGTLAATGGTGGVFLNNTGNLTIGTVSGLSGVMLTAGDVQVATTGNLAVGQAVSSGANVVLTATGGALTTTAAVSATGNANLTSTGGVLTTGQTVTATANVILNATGGALTTNAAVMAGGSATLTANADAVALNANVTGATGVTATATDAATAGQDLTVGAGAVISAGTNINVDLRAGDNLTVNGTVTTTGTGVTTLTGDFGSADALGTVLTVTGATLNSATPLQLTGGADADTFATKLFTQQQTVTGANPTALPGDVLNLTLTGVTTPVATVGTTGPVGTGNVTGAGQGVLTFTSIETINNATPAVPLAVNLALFALGFQNASANPDVVAVSTTAGVLNVTVQDNSTGAPVSVYNGASAGIGSFAILGSTDTETFNLDLTGLAVPAVSVAGGTPTGATGDALNLLNVGGTTGAVFTPGAPGAGTFTFVTPATSITYTGIEAVTPGLVTIVASDAAAAETDSGQPANPGQFLVTRAGDLTSALTVNYTIGGTAVAGSDYPALSGSVTIPAGAASATIDVSVLVDGLVEPTETVTVTLVAGPGYTISGGAAATVAIADNPPVPVVATPFYSNAVIIGNLLILQGAGVPGGTQVVPVPSGSFLLFTDINGDSRSDVILFLPTLVVVLDGATGRFLALAADRDGDGFREVLVFNPDGTTTTTNGRTGITVTS